MQKENIFRLWGITILLGAIILASMLQANLQPSLLQTVKTKTDRDVFQGLRLFSESLSTIKQKCLRNVDIQMLVQDALKSSLSKIDPHSSFISNYEQISDAISGNFSGIGISVIGKNNDEDSLLVIDVLDGSPAQKAAISPGDKIFSVDDQRLNGLSCDEVINKLRGKKGSAVKLKILRNKKVIEVILVRDTIHNRSSFGYHFEKQQVYYLNLKTFSENAPKQMKKLVTTINNDEKCKGLILDLRANPGGVMDAAIEVASLFLPPKSLIVSTKNKNGEQVNEYRTIHTPILQRDLLFFVIINNFTASAAEILAGALSHHAKAMNRDNAKYKLMVFLVGTTTFGKGSVQEVIPLPGNCALKLTSMLYFLPNGESVQAKGVRPDLPIMPMRGLSTEEKFLHELYGLEKSMHHHISQEEVAALSKKQALPKHSIIDKKTTQTIQKIEDKQQSFANTKDAEDPFSLDFGDIVDKAATVTDKPNEEKAQAEESTSQCDPSNVEAKRQKAIANDYYIKTCLSMISYLDLFKKAEPILGKTFTGCHQALLDAFNIKNDLKMIHLTE